MPQDVNPDPREAEFSEERVPHSRQVVAIPEWTSFGRREEEITRSPASTLSIRNTLVGTGTDRRAWDLVGPKISRPEDWFIEALKLGEAQGGRASRSAADLACKRGSS